MKEIPFLRIIREKHKQSYLNWLRKEEEKIPPTAQSQEEFKNNIEILDKIYNIKEKTS